MDNSKPVACRGGRKKGKSSAHFPPVTVEYKNDDEIPEDVKKLINDFLNCTTTESQLAVTKSILDSLGQLQNDKQEKMMKFLVLVLFESEPKHPVKCLLMRQVDQMEEIHEIFMKHLSEIILSYELYLCNWDYNSKTVKFILGLSCCLEKFALGVRTVQNNASKVLYMLSRCILCCKDKLRYCQSTTEELEVGKVLHQTLHLYLNVYQKATLDDNQLNQKARYMNSIMYDLVFRDISMDTKTLCAVIHITMEKSLNKILGDPWVHGNPMLVNYWGEYWEREESVLLCLYCALISSAPADLARRLDFSSSPEVATHILTLIKNVIDITDRLSGSVSVLVCGARALAAASHWLDNAGPPSGKSDESGLHKDQSDLNEDESDSNEDESDSSKDESESKYKSESDPDYDPWLLPLKNRDCGESDSNESDESDSNESESGPDWWSYPLRKREYENDEVYMGRTLELARLLVRFAACRLQHHVPAVSHLAEDIHANVMLYCLQYHPEEVRGWLKVEAGWGCGRAQLALLRRVDGPTLRRLAAPSYFLPQLQHDHKQPHIAALLESYIEKDCSDLSSELVFARWFPPVLELVRCERPLSSVVTDILVKLLAKAIDIQDQLLSFVLPLIENPDTTTPANLKCTLFLMNVISKSNASKKYQDTDDKWKGLISYDVLEAAILDDDDQIARLCTMVAPECEEARVVVAWLRGAAHRPRALHPDTLRALTLFLKRLEKEYRSCSERDKYREILQKLREICFSNLIRGANHYRRGVALFVLKAITGIQLEGNESEWSQDEVGTVLRHLDDSYDANRQMALDILTTCPKDLLRAAVLAHNMNSVQAVLEGVSCRARDAQGAAYRLELLVAALPDLVLQASTTGQRVKVESVRYAACAAALQLPCYPGSVHGAAALTLLRTQLDRLPLTWHDERGKARPLSDCCEWHDLASRAFDRALGVLDDAAPLVEAASPEGLVPYTFFGHIVEPHPNEPHLYMVGKEAMTSQAMLLFAWTCAKEAWLILGRASQLLRWGALCMHWQALAACVARARHRAVHEHATKAYTAILRRLLELDKSRTVSSVGEMAVQWVGGADGTRRAAGLAGLVLAVAAASPDLRYVDVRALTDIHQTGAHHAAMALVRAREVARAAHGVLPCLVRHALHDADSPLAALQWACVGVVGAGVRRMAGAHAPGGGGVAPGERGRLRTSVFMSRYPGLYQYILECVERGRAREKSMCASLACSLLLLSRLLPDAGTTSASASSTSTARESESALPGGVEAACGSASYHTRRLAAAAAAANLPPNVYLEHASAVLTTLSEQHTAKNLCHGLILRLLAMIDEAPELPWAPVFALGLPPTLWIVDSPCFPLVHEYLNLVIVLVNRYPSSLEAGYRSALGEGCRRVALGRVLPGAQLCAARALGVAAALLDPVRAADLISNGLNSTVHEICLASLECLLSARGEDGGALPVAPAVRAALGEGEGEPALLERVARIMRTHSHLECRQRSLHVLVLEGARALSYIFGEVQHSWCSGPLEMWVIDKLLWYMRSSWSEWLWPGRGVVVFYPGRGAPAVPRAQALYALALSTHLHSMRAAAHPNHVQSERESERERERERYRACMERVSRCVWEWSGAGAGAGGAVRALLREHTRYLATYDDDSLHISVLLGAASARLTEGGYPGRPPALGEGEGATPALLLALALLDFGFEEQTEDDLYRGFEIEADSESYEEAVWTDRCTDILTEKYAQTSPGQTVTPYILTLIDKYTILEAVCGIHLANFMKLIKGDGETSNLHHKVELFVEKLKAYDASIQVSS